MSTLVGHALAGAVVSSGRRTDLDPRARRVLVVLAVVIAVLPDLDIVVFLALRPLGMVPHRGFSHTLAFALLSSTAFTLVARGSTRLGARRVWPVLFASAASHLFLDWAMGAGPPVPLFFPFSDQGYLLGVKALPIAYYGRQVGTYLDPGFWMLNAIAVALEVLILGPVLMLRAGTPATRFAKGLAVALASTSLAVSFLMYN